MTYEYFIGIDPGQTGAIAVLDKNGELVEVIDNITIKRKINNKTNRDEIDTAKTLGFLLKYKYSQTYVEELGNRSGNAFRSTQTTALNFGKLVAASELSESDLTYINAQVWQKHFGLNTGTKNKKLKKKEIATRCLHILPSSRNHIYGPRGGLLDGRSDAVMIARYAYQKSS